VLGCRSSGDEKVGTPIFASPAPKESKKRSLGEIDDSLRVEFRGAERVEARGEDVCPAGPGAEPVMPGG
jgi:hypothetical protein